MSEQKKKFTGVFIPARIWEAKNLTWLEKCLIAEIEALEDDDRGCWASNKYLAKVFGVTPGGINNMLRRLKRFGHIVIAPFDGFSRSIRIAPLHPPMQGGASEDVGGLHPPMHSLLEENKEENKEESTAVAESSTLLRNQQPPPSPLQNGAATPKISVTTGKSAKSGNNTSSPEGLEEADEFRKLLPDGMVPPRNWRASWGSVFDAMAEEGRDEEEMWRVIRWARDDSFWSPHVMSPVALRKKSNGVQLYDRLLAVMSAATKKAVCSPRL